MAIDLEKLQESPNLLDILIQMEDVLDTMDVYVFKNWLKGEVVEGPIVRRYWLDMTLRYPFRNPDGSSGMPDPRAALRLLKHNVRVDYQKARYETEKFGEGVIEEVDENETGDDLVWLLKVSIPRRLVVQMNAASHDFYDDEVDIDQVEDAQDSGMDNETGYHTDEQGGDDMAGGDMGMGEPPGGAPGGPPPMGGPGAPGGGMKPGGVL